MRKIGRKSRRIRERVRKILGTAALAGAVSLWGAGAVCGEVYVSEGLYDDWDSEDDEDENQGGMAEPGVPASQVAQEKQTGPSVDQVALSERYHDDYKVYEESMGDLFFFYASVSNGGITDKDVTLDIPRNIEVDVEKDGEPMGYVRGQTISGYGTYVVRLTAVENPEEPFSRQREYTALFRFRIQEKPPEEISPEGTSSGFPYGEERAGQAEETETEDAFDVGSILQSERETGESVEDTEETGESSQAGDSEGNGEPPQGEGTEETDPVPEDQAGQPGDGETGEGPETETVPEDQAGQPGEGETEAVQPEREGGRARGPYSARSQTYDGALGLYQVVFENGRTLTANIPEGYIGPSAVELSVSEGQTELYRDDQPVEFTPGQSLTEPGYYRLEADGQPWSFVIASAVRQMDCYPAPAGMTITGAALDGEPRKLSSGRQVSMEEDGLYQIFMTGEGGEELEVFLKKDTQAPQAQVTVSGGSANIQYLSDDLETIVLEKNGEVQSGFSGYSIKSPGTYRLTVSDQAGNVSSQEFTVQFRLNGYAVMAIVLVLLVAAGMVVFVVHMKKNVKVR